MIKQAPAIVVLLLTLVGCSQNAPEATVMGKCATDLFPSYDPKDLKQCVPACIKCQNGSTTTCTTSCTLKGAK